MTERATDPTILDAIELLARYSFDLGTFAAEHLVEYWVRRYPASWVRSAVIEALYQGRYKAVSVGQILAIWGRRGQPIYHFNAEFERIVSTRFLMIHASNKPNSPTDAPTAGEAAQELDAGDAAKAENESPEAEQTSYHLDALDSIDILSEEAGWDDARLEPDHPDHEFSHEMNGDSPTAAASIRLPNLTLLDNASLPWEEGAAQFVEPAPHAGSPEIWGRGDVTKYPIHRFVPEPEGSLFYIKLRAVAYDEAFPETSAGSPTRF